MTRTTSDTPEKKTLDTTSSTAELKAAADAILAQAKAKEKAEAENIGENPHEEPLDFSLEDELSLRDDQADSRDLEIARLENELTDSKDRLLRSLAEAENTRRRADRDKKDAETYGGTKLARDILGVFDNLERALGALTDEVRETMPDLVDGLELTRQEMLNVFAKHKILPVAPEPGERFDPNHHQAMFEAPVPGAEPGSVIQLMQSGFTIADRLLRPAMVGVAKAEAQKAEESTADPTENMET